VAKNIVLLDNDIANMDPNAKFDPIVWSRRLIALGHPALYFQGATRGVYGTWEFDQDPIACSLDNAAAIFPDFWFEELASVRVEARQGAFLVSTHQPAVSSNVACEDGGQSSLYSPLLGHVDRLPTIGSECMAGSQGGVY